MVKGFNRVGVLSLAAACAYMEELGPEVLEGIRVAYMPEEGRGIMYVAEMANIDPDVVALVVRGYGYKRRTCSGAYFQRPQIDEWLRRASVRLARKQNLSSP